MIDLKVPSVGESITEGRILRWLVASGSAVKVDQTVLELETDKATAEVAATSNGVIQLLAKEGDVVAIGAIVAKIDPAGSPSAPAPTSSPTPFTNPAPQAAPAATNNFSSPSRTEPILSPAAKRVVDEQKLDANAIAGTGRDGRITKEDAVQAAATKPTSAVVKAPTAPATKVLAEGREVRQPMTMIRRRIAERLLESQQTTATLTTFNECDLTAITELRAKYKDRFKEKQGVNLGFMSFFVKASIEALKAFPAVNARIDASDIVYQNFYDIGVAVSTERGLMVPILRDADRLSFAEIEKKIGEVAVKARDNKIAISDLQGGTFTITNGGIFGSLLSTPILNPPQAAILGMHTIQKRPVVVNDQIVIRPMMYLALSYDHRLIDGREAVQFLVRIKECVENPERLLLEI
jgi:2-oxoglutarate dehydrogenase E2 component (dihydrolipoamide succinyltransferase)